MCQRFVFAQQRILAPGAGHRCHPSAVPAADGDGKGKGWEWKGEGMESLGVWDPPAPPLPTPASHPREPNPAASSTTGSQAGFYLPGYAASSRVGAMRSFLFQEQVKESKRVSQFPPWEPAQ